MTDDDLIKEALRVREHAYCKYSRFKVGAALIDNQGQLHVGCNVENASYSEVSCAEAGAISAMVASGGKSIQTIAVAGGHDAVESCTPCGGCRQRINEFKSSSMRILVVDDDLEWHTYSMDDLLPHSFHLEDV